MGRAADFRLPRRRHQRRVRRAAARQGQDRVHPGPPRGDGGVHGLGPRQVHRRARRLHRDLGAGRLASDHRPLRCRLDHMPVLALCGQQARTALGGHYQQEVDLPAMFRDVAGAYVQQASMPSQVRHLIDRAVRIAIGERRVTALIFPNDMQEVPYEEPPRAHGTLHSGVGYTAPRVVPYEADLRRAADILNAGKKVAMLVGAGALARHRRGDRGRRQARRRLRQGAARQGRAARRPALGDRLDRAARHQAELRSDDGMRHAAHGRLGIPLRRVPAEGGPGQGRPDRH